jgi:hypothetical protein
MTPWHHKLSDSIALQGPAAYLTDFPTYRPDLVEDIARALDCTYLDFRRDYLAPLKFEAHMLPLAAIETCIAEDANPAGIVIQNGEALLAAKPADERLAWLRAFLEEPRGKIVLLPLALFGRDLPNHARLIRFLPHELPAETLLQQLTSIRFP